MSLRALLLAAFSYVLMLTAIAFAIPLTHVLTERIQGEVRSQAQAQAQLVGVGSSARTDGTVIAARRAALQRAVDTAAQITRGRLIIVDAHGALQVDSARPGAACPASACSISGRVE
jgi:hypothetical protein